VPAALDPRFRGGDGKERPGTICLVRTTRAAGAAVTVADPRFGRRGNFLRSENKPSPALQVCVGLGPMQFFDYRLYLRWIAEQSDPSADPAARL
jgi:hypothetical protein